MNALEGLGTVCSECAWGCLGPFAVNAAEGFGAVCSMRLGGLGPFAVNKPGGLGAVCAERAWGPGLGTFGGLAPGLGRGACRRPPGLASN